MTEQEGTLHELVLVEGKGAPHAHIRTKIVGKPEKNPRSAGCWKCLAGETVTSLTAMELHVTRFSLADLNKPHEARRDCHCYDCFMRRFKAIVVDVRQMVLDLNDCVAKVDADLERAYGREEDLQDELYDMRDRLAKLTGEQLILHDEVPKTKAKKKAKKKSALKSRPVEGGASLVEDGVEANALDNDGNPFRSD
jgi:hypothetical protein